MILKDGQLQSGGAVEERETPRPGLTDHCYATDFCLSKRLQKVAQLTVVSIGIGSGGGGGGEGGGRGGDSPPQVSSWRGIAPPTLPTVYIMNFIAVL